MPGDASVAREAKARDDFTCQKCGYQRESVHAHHIVPTSEGGPDTIDNIVTLCSRCHRYAPDHGLPTDFYEELCNLYVNTGLPPEYDFVWFGFSLGVLLEQAIDGEEDDKIEWFQEAHTESFEKNPPTRHLDVRWLDAADYGPITIQPYLTTRSPPRMSPMDSSNGDDEDEDAAVEFHPSYIEKYDHIDDPLESWENVTDAFFNQVIEILDFNPDVINREKADKYLQPPTTFIEAHDDLSREDARQ